ncbi:hypothetical protein LCGC14_1458630 [marine sediment metagenome]|uniref:Disease resistance R13L4/SHOC-2-like LRR domain-containing protein n=1 Tax=marine sediment metagenome TaxID=412755 RepID=A0A0F9JFQ0_9ZZZZ|nr:leucine-rich repeat domain-containing protein [archaeon]
MARGSAKILDDDEEIDTAHFMLKAIGLDYDDFFNNERILIRENIEKNFHNLRKMVDNRSRRRASYFVLGYFILITGARLPEDLRGEILDAARWEHEEGLWLDKSFETERKIYLEDFGEKIRGHKPGKKLHPVKLIYINGKNDLYTKDRKDTIIGLTEYLNSCETGRILNVKYILLEGWGLKSIPKEILELKDLEYLNLDFNQLTELPDEISNLTSLKHLSLGYNLLSTLPKSIGDLKSLEVLGINHNDISLIPESMKNLKNLKVIGVRGTSITHAPKFLKDAKFDGYAKRINTPKYFDSIKKLYRKKQDYLN